MKVYKDTFDSIISLENLFSAWKVFKSDKHNKLDVAGFEWQLEQEIFQLHNELKSYSYTHGPYEDFWICDPKWRHIFKALVRDRVLHHAIFAILYPLYDRTFISTLFSCRIGKGNHKGVQYLRDTAREVSRNYTQPCFVLKCDIRKFFDSVDHETLFNILRRKIHDRKTLDLLRILIDSYEVAITRERERERETALRAGAYPTKPGCLLAI